MRIIKLTQHENGEPVFVNGANVTHAFENKATAGTIIRFTAAGTMGQAQIVVREDLDEVSKQLSEA